MFRIYRKFCRDQRGAIAMWIGLSMTVILGAGALAVDMSSFYMTRAQLRNTASSAALAAVHALPAQSDALSAAQSYAELNMPAAQNGHVITSDDVTVGNWDSTTRTFTANGTPVNAVEVTAKRAQANGNPAPTYFSRALGFASMDIETTAIARRLRGRGCVIALNPSAAKSVYAQGTINVSTQGCDFQVNSCDATSAWSSQGGVTFTTNNGQITICGGAQITGPGNYTPSPVDHTNEQLADPFSGISQPATTLYDDPGDCNHTNFTSSGNVDLYPGVYCGGITLSGSGLATFHGTGGDLPDGLYIIKDGPLDVAGTMAMKGLGVTFFMTGATANIDMAGTSDVGLSAPTSGGLKGFVFFGDRANPADASIDIGQGGTHIYISHLLRGTSLGGYDGYVYLSGAIVGVTGTATGTVASHDCTIAIADQFKFAGTATFETTHGCGDFGALPIDTYGLVN